jgi:uncharacterized membrane protein YoaK (UPF0700 family)
MRWPHPRFEFVPFFAVVALAGAVDALILMHAHDLLAVYMTGNTSQLGDALARGLWSRAAPLFSIIVAFFLATTAAAWIGSRSRSWRSSVILALCTCGLAVASRLAGVEYSLATICLIAASMGALNQVRGDQSGVTFITGTLVSVGRQVASGQMRDAGFGALRWLSFLVGAWLGTLLDASVNNAALSILAGTAAVLALIGALETRSMGPHLLAGADATGGTTVSGRVSKRSKR